MRYVDAKGILSANNGMNLYRGCTHGCIYCDSRSVCYGMKHAFSDVEIKQNAPDLLEKALRSKRKKCMISTGAMTDPYLHLEAEIGLTRRCLEIIDRYGFGISILTKSDLILRDIDLLEKIHEKARCAVQMTLTTYDDELCRMVEPQVCVTSRRVQVLREFAARGIPTVVWLTPILPFLNDTEENLRGILDLCFDAGVKGIICYGMGLTLREGNREYFYSALDQNFPGLKEKYQRTYGNSYVVMSPQNQTLMRMFWQQCKKHGVLSDPDKCFAFLNEFPPQEEQLSFF